MAYYVPPRLKKWGEHVPHQIAPMLWTGLFWMDTILSRPWVPAYFLKIYFVLAFRLR